MAFRSSTEQYAIMTKKRNRADSWKRYNQEKRTTSRISPLLLARTAHPYLLHTVLDPKVQKRNQDKRGSQRVDVSWLAALVDEDRDKDR